MSEPDALVVFCTCPDEAMANRLAELAVEERAAACVNVLPAIQSIYRWQGKTVRDAELLLVAKTKPAALPRLEQIWRAHHSYELPEVIALPVVGGSEAYLQWINANTVG